MRLTPSLLPPCLACLGDSQGPVQLSARSLMGTGGRGSSARSSSLGRAAAPWLGASMGHSNAAITSWCFVSIRVAQEEIWCSALNYGPL